ncbi:hypothetical protein SDC9_166589 [bioreactor metagenome]|uniref:Uncharacterized protein n=1 Tax=bioreactor metagenome TaxID=1076179 RepID=A0A645G5D3_9ZZZZ
MLIQQKGNFKLCAHAIGTRNEHWTGYTGQIRHQHAAKTTDGVQNGGGAGARHMFFHQLNRLVACGYIHARGAVAFGKAVLHLKTSPLFKVSRFLR